jgi:hypothetical protein
VPLFKGRVRGGNILMRQNGILRIQEVQGLFGGGGIPWLPYKKARQ